MLQVMGVVMMILYLNKFNAISNRDLSVVLFNKYFKEEDAEKNILKNSYIHVNI